MQILFFVLLVVGCSSCICIRKPLALPVHVNRDRWRDVRTRVVSKIPPSTRNSLASAMAAAVVKFALQPFDTVKTLQQTNLSNKGIIGTMVARVSQHGVGSLWTGAGVTVLGSAVSTALYFGIFNAVKVRIAAALPVAKAKPLVVAMSAVAGNTVACILRSPYEVLKSRMQVSGHPSLYRAATDLLREEGVAGLFAGGKLLSQIARDIPYSVVIGVCYEALQGLASRRKEQQVATALLSSSADPDIDLPSDSTSQGVRAQLAIKQNWFSGKVAQDAICGGIAGGVGTFVTTPMDVVKTRLMSGRSEFSYSSVGNAVSRIAREEGVGAFFRGSSSRLLHKIPANGLFYLFYEGFRVLLDVGEAYN
jgi:solute carrier family 25 S-adenosylmethionine transporter 26